VPDSQRHHSPLLVWNPEPGDHIDTVFTSACLPSSKYKPAIRAAIETAKKTLNQYYSLTDASESYRIVMGTQYQTHFHVVIFG